MSRKNHNAVDPKQFLEIAKENGLQVLDSKKTEWKVYATTKKQSLGIPKTEKKGVTRVELVGFTHPLGITHPKPPAGTVQQMMDFTKEPDEIIKDFTMLCKFLAAEAKSEIENEVAEVENKEQEEALTEQDEDDIDDLDVAIG